MVQGIVSSSIDLILVPARDRIHIFELQDNAYLERMSQEYF